MKTLPDYNYDNSKKYNATSNFADYVTVKPYVCCGWMDMHIDEKYDKHASDYFIIKIIKAHSNAILVYKDDNNRYTSTSLTEGEIYKIPYRKYHGVIPKRLAKLIVEQNKINVKGYRQWKHKIDGKICKPKVIWEWVYITTR
jgi:hypothetical protein